MVRRVERVILALILALFVSLGVVYSVVVPPFEASDEKWHYPMVKTIADHWSLPVQEPGVETPWRQEGSQPPLYYALAAAATFWIDTSDMEAVRHINPYVDPGATEDGNVNLVVHNAALERFPWRGTVLAIHVVRFLSVSMGAAAVYLTYLIVRQVLPGRPAMALGTAAIHAFTPMFLFISGSVNNDNLVVPLSSLALLMLLRLLRPMSFRSAERVGMSFRPTEGAIPIGRYLTLGVVLGLAALTKTSSLALTLLTALVVVVRAVRRRSWAEFFVGGAATSLPLLLIAGWWYLRNLRLYGDLFGLNVFIEILGQRDVPADVAQLWRERFSFLAGYWGNFGGLNVPMPDWAYTALNGVVVVAALGWLFRLARYGIAELGSFLSDGQVRRSPHIGLRDFLYRRGGLILCILWGLGILIPWSRWAAITWSSQGRLVFPAISVWSLLLTLGLAGWFPREWGKWAVAVLALFLLDLSAVAPFAWIAPVYALPEPLTDAQVDAVPQRVDAVFGDIGPSGASSEGEGVMRLLGYDLETEIVEPGGEVAVTLYWEALRPAARDYTVFVHLLGEGELVVAQRDTFPGLGLFSTRRLSPGFRWADRTVLRVPETAYAPDEAQIQVGLYDRLTGARLPVIGPDGEPGGDAVRFGQVRVRARPGDVPNPISVNFGDRMALVGYDLSRRVVRPGETVTLTLYWRGLRPMDVDYTVSVQLVDVEQRKAAQLDGWPMDGAAPTTTWEPGGTVTDVRTMSIHPDAAPGVYEVRVAVYALEEQQLVHVPVISAAGRMLSDHVNLTRVRVVP